MIRVRSKEYKRYINFEAIGKLVNNHPVVEGNDKRGNKYTGLGVENENRTIVEVKEIKLVKSEIDV